MSGDPACLPRWARSAEGTCRGQRLLGGTAGGPVSAVGGAGLWSQQPCLICVRPVRAAQGGAGARRLLSCRFPSSPVVGARGHRQEPTSAFPDPPVLCVFKCGFCLRFYYSPLFELSCCVFLTPKLDVDLVRGFILFW